MNRYLTDIWVAHPATSNSDHRMDIEDVAKVVESQVHCSSRKGPMCWDLDHACYFTTVC